LVCGQFEPKGQLPPWGVAGMGERKDFGLAFLVARERRRWPSCRVASRNVSPRSSLEVTRGVQRQITGDCQPSHSVLMRT